MLLSIALILLCGLLLGQLCRLLRLPTLVGMLFAGIIIGPYCLDLIDSSILSISTQLRRIALVIILTRAGLGLDTSFLRRLGRPALLMCFVPATFELLGVLILGRPLLGLSILECALLGAVLSAVSPAVVVPRMVRLTEEGYGVKQGVPQLVLAGASVDDVYVIVLFSTFLSMLQGNGVSWMSFVNIPVSIALGMAIGSVLGAALSFLFEKTHASDTVSVIVLLSVSLVLVSIEDFLETQITFSSLIAIMFLGVGIRRRNLSQASDISVVYKKMWTAAEIFLFVLVGACVDISYLPKVGLGALVLIFGALLFRMAGVFVSLLGTSLTLRERLFVMLSYTPKATVQAAIGGLALSMGLPCGETVLTSAVLAIVITAPLGAFAIDLSYRKLLEKN